MFNGGVATKAVLTNRVPRGVVREREVNGREVVSLDPVLEDGGCELLIGDPGSERRPQELLQRMAGTEEAGEGDSRQDVGDGEDELPRELRERHSAFAGSKGIFCGGVVVLW